MFNLKKLMTAAVAAVMSVSAIGVCAYADDSSDDVMGRFLNEDGEYQTVYTRDVLLGNDTYTLIDGTIITYALGDSMNSVFQVKGARASSNFTATSKPSYSSTAYSIENAHYEGAASLSAGATKYSNRILNNGDASNMLLAYTPQDEDLSDTTCALHVYTTSSASKEFCSLSGGMTERTAYATNVPSNYRFFVKVTNSSSSSKNPYIDVSGWE